MKIIIAIKNKKFTSNIFNIPNILIDVVNTYDLLLENIKNNVFNFIIIDNEILLDMANIKEIKKIMLGNPYVFLLCPIEQMLSYSNNYLIDEFIFKPLCKEYLEAKLKLWMNKSFKNECMFLNIFNYIHIGVNKIIGLIPDNNNNNNNLSINFTNVFLQETYEIKFLFKLLEIDYLSCSEKEILNLMDFIKNYFMQYNISVFIELDSNFYYNKFSIDTRKHILKILFCLLKAQINFKHIKIFIKEMNNIIYFYCLNYNFLNNFILGVKLLNSLINNLKNKITINNSFENNTYDNYFLILQYEI